MKYKTSDYTFGAFFASKGKLPTKGQTIGYLISLVRSKNHAMADPDEVEIVLPMFFELEDQVRSAAELLILQKEGLKKGCFPQTPVMIAREWSPISSMLERGLEPLVLKRRKAYSPIVTGIWRPVLFQASKPLKLCKTDQDLFWTVLAESFKRGKERGLLVSVAAMLGWSYDEATTLRRLTNKEIVKADRILWKRIPK